MTFNRVLFQILLILGVSFLFGLGYNIIRDDEIPFIAQKKVYEQADNSVLGLDSTKQGIEPSIKMVDLAMAKNLYDKGVTFIDARDESEYSDGHIKGALYVSAIQLAEIISFDDPLVTYCDDADCELSLHLAEDFADFGFSRIFVFSSGWSDWKSAGYPIESGK